jgi:hypothetical protein
VKQAVLSAADYIKRRLAEKTTWSAIVAAVTSAALLPSPWAETVVIASIVMVLLPSPKRKRRRHAPYPE